MRHLSVRMGRFVLGALLISAMFFTSVLAGGITIDPDENILVLHEGEVFEETLTVTVPAEAAISKADVYFMADNTGTMAGAIDGTKAGASTLLSELKTNLPETDLHFGVGNYKDFPFDDYAFRHQVSLTNVDADILAGINAWKADGGYDGPEGQFYALDRLADDVNPGGGTIGWRPDAKKIIVWFGDAPAHDPVCSEISGLPFDITESSVTNKLVDAKISVIAINVGSPPGLDGDPTFFPFDYEPYCQIGGYRGQAARIAAATNGVDVVGIDPGELVPIIAALIEEQARSIANLNLVPTGDIIPFVTSLTPEEGYGPIETDEETTWPFELTLTGIECGEEDAVYNGTIDVVADDSVEAQKTVQITVPACLSTVGIDIRPGSYPNPINPFMRGSIPVAILGSADFDVYDVDVHTLDFAGLSVNVLKNGRLQCAYNDVSGDFTNPKGAPDGYTDLLCHYVMDATHFTPGDGFATLTGLLLDSTPFEGSDSIKIVR